MKGICQKSDVLGVIIIPWSVLSKSPPKALIYIFVEKVDEMLPVVFGTKEPDRKKKKGIFS